MGKWVRGLSIVLHVLDLRSYSGPDISLAEAAALGGEAS